MTLLAVLAPKVRRRAPERSYWGEGDKHDRDSRFTPLEFLAHIYEAFGPIDLDPCGHESSPVIAKQRILLSEGGDGLAEPWSGRLVYVNPPFSKFLVWLKRAHEQWQVGNAETVLCLGPVRTDSIWFQDVLCNDADIYLLGGVCSAGRRSSSGRERRLSRGTSWRCESPRRQKGARVRTRPEWGDRAPPIHHRTFVAAFLWTTLWVTLAF